MHPVDTSWPGFQPLGCGSISTQGFALGWYRSAPLALSRFTFQGFVAGLKPCAPTERRRQRLFQHPLNPCPSAADVLSARLNEALACLEAKTRFVGRHLLLFGVVGGAVLIDGEMGYGVRGGVAEELDLSVDDLEEELRFGLGEELDLGLFAEFGHKMAVLDGDDVVDRGGQLVGAGVVGEMSRYDRNLLAFGGEDQGLAQGHFAQGVRDLVGSPAV